MIQGQTPNRKTPNRKDLQAAKIGYDKKFIQRQIATTDKQIDQLVYELYGLTEEEIRIVEEVTTRNP